MSRHIMAVCVVCLLCADHVPCKEHLNNNNNSPIQNLDINSNIYPSVSSDSGVIPESYGYYDQYISDNKLPLSPSTYDIPKSRRKSKRHAGGHHADHEHNDHQQHEHIQRPEITNSFLKRIFSEYGDADGTIKFSGLENILKKLGLYNETTTEQQPLPPPAAAACGSIHDVVRRVNPKVQKMNTAEKCSSSETTHCDDKLTKNNKNFTTYDILNLCPIFLYQLISTSTNHSEGCIAQSIINDADHHISHLSNDFTNNSKQNDMFYVWLYGTLSVLGCSILGLVGVSILPCMDSKFYKEVIQFFVALAVGTMSGDALLHLLPHAIAGQTENNIIFKGLTAMGGMIFFYATEHGLTMISEWRKGKKKNDKQQQNSARVLRDPEPIANSAAGDKLCKSKYSSYPYCYDEIAMDTKNDIHQPNHNNHHHPRKISNNKVENGNTNVNIIATEHDLNETAQSLLSENFTPVSDVTQNITGSNTVSTNLNEGSIVDCATGIDKSQQPLVKSDPVTVILREHESSHHGHSHKHGHVHSPPGSLSAVAWMIILGDGLHNFTDGMAIGAAFADNLAGGFSTSLAVFCHELPHELGDFAILIKAGMSIRSAIYYNILSSVLSFIGMFFGILFGQSQDAAQWMFAAAAGMFIYIALVDMMPEMSSAHKNLQQCCLQILGMLSGLMIMLMIALYERDLMEIFSPSHTFNGN